MKKLQEISGLKRVHEIASFIEVGGVFQAIVNIIREGIDDTYEVEITQEIYNDNDKTIEYIASINNNLVII